MTMRLQSRLAEAMATSSIPEIQDGANRRILGSASDRGHSDVDEVWIRVLRLLVRLAQSHRIRPVAECHDFIRASHVFQVVRFVPRAPGILIRLEILLASGRMY